MNALSTAVAAMLILATSSWAAPTDPADIPKLRVPKLKTPPTIDGTLTPGEWQGAAGISALVVAGGASSTIAAPNQQVSFYMGYDDKYLYLAMRSPHKGGAYPQARCKTADDMAVLFEDHIEFQINKNTRAQANTNGFGFYKMMVNPRGAMIDQWINSGIVGAEDLWSTGGKIKCSVTPTYWDLEMSVELAQMKLEKIDGRSLVMWLARSDSCAGANFLTWGPGFYMGWDTMPEVTFDPAAPAVQLADVGNIMDGSPEVIFNLSDATAKAHRLAGSLKIINKAGQTVCDEKATVKLAANGQAVLRLAKTGMPIDETGNTVFLEVREGDTVLYYNKMPLARMTETYRTNSLAPWLKNHTLPTADWYREVASLPGEGLTACSVDLTESFGVREQVQKADRCQVEILNAKGNSLAKDWIVMVDGAGSKALPTGVLPEGDYTARFTLFEGNTMIEEKAVAFVQKLIPWATKRSVISDQVRFSHPVVLVPHFAAEPKLAGILDAPEWAGAAVFTAAADRPVATNTVLPAGRAVTWSFGDTDSGLSIAMRTPLPSAAGEALADEQAVIEVGIIDRTKASAPPATFYRAAVTAQGKGIPLTPGQGESWKPLDFQFSSRVTNGVWELAGTLGQPCAPGNVLTFRLERVNARTGSNGSTWVTACGLDWGNLAATAFDAPTPLPPFAKLSEAVAGQWGEGLLRGSSARAVGAGWPLGHLDPARGVADPSPPVAPMALRLERRRPIIPVYTVIERRSGDLFKVNEYDLNLPSGHDRNGVAIAAEGDPNATYTLLVDFGLNFPGTFEFEANPPKGVEVIIETGEAMHPTRTYRTTVQADGSNQVFRPAITQAGWTSLRFAWIHFRGVRDRSFQVRRLHGLYQHFQSPYLGDFACSDETLTRVWELCAYSARTAMAQPLGNDPTPKTILQTLTIDRCDRSPWAGDSRSIQATVGYLFGQYPLIQLTIERLLPTGTRPIPDLQGIPPYTLDWGLGLFDYYRLSGDRAYFLKRLPDLVAILEKYDGPVPVPGGYGLFFDWDKRVIPATQENRPELEACFTAKYVQYGRELAWAAEQAGENATAAKAAAVANRHESEWRKAQPDWAKKYALHAISNLILGGLLKPDEYAAAFARAYPDRNRWTTSPFFTAYVLSALAQMGRHAEALDLARDYWGGMIAVGATTVWEEWDPKWRLPVNAQPPQFSRPLAWGGLSLNQPVGTTPARWLIEEILGVKPTAPGFRLVRVRPNTAGLEWAKGSVATPMGAMNVEWKRVGQNVELSSVIPSGIEAAEFVMPKESRCVVNGRELAPTPAKDGIIIYRFASVKGE
jgi:hypothetical protein